MGSSGSSGGGASGGSIASIGTQFYANMLKVQGDQYKAQADQFRAEGESEGDTYQSERLDVAAQYGDLKATQTSGQMTRNLNNTMQNIDAVRAAANTDPTSPTGAAVRDYTEAVGTDQRNITVGNITSQTDQERSDASYFRTASANALLSGGIAVNADNAAATADTVGAYATAFTSLNKMGP
jgi:hypothetical protein